MCEKDAGSIALDWTSYREHQTEFIKASTSPKSICKQLYNVFRMTDNEKSRLGKKARQWVIDNFSTESVGKFWNNSSTVWTLLIMTFL